MNENARRFQKSFNNNGKKEFFLTISTRSFNELHDFLKEISDFVNDRNAKIFRQEVFASKQNAIQMHEQIEAIFETIYWPVNIIESTSNSSENINCYFHIIHGLDVSHRVTHNNAQYSVYEDDYTKYLFIKDNVNSDLKNEKELTRDTLDTFQYILNDQNMTYQKVIRTWFYLDNILGWYGDFNNVRNAFYQENGIYNGIIPASTGIGASNPESKPISASLLALNSEKGNIRTYESPKQCAALDYGSSFSRATGIETEFYNKAWISGTASINEKGYTVYENDIEKQISYTMEVVEAILVNGGYNWENVVRSVVYFRNDGDVNLFYKYLKNNKLTFLPAMVTTNVICRDNLLFEIEVDAIINKQ